MGMKRHNILMKESGDVAACADRVVSACQLNGGIVVHKNKNLPIVSAFLDDTGVQNLRLHPDVFTVQVDVEVQTSGYENSWGVQRIEAPAVHQSGNSGMGIKVAIIDTGSNLNHENLVVAGHVNFIDPAFSGDDDNGHGSHVHGILAGRGVGGVTGVAPEAEVYALKCLGANGNGLFSDVISALDWCIANGIQVINHSYGTSTYPGTVVETAYERATAAGIVHVAAAGNRGPGDNTLDWPGAFGGIWCVGAVDQNDVAAPFSSRGSTLNIAAPGVDITSAWIGGTNAVNTISGTSMACPHAAGSLALALAVEKTLFDIQDAALDLGAPGRDDTYGEGRVQVLFLADEEEPEEPTVYGRHLMFDASGSFDPDGEIVSYLYTFGDGHSARVVHPMWEHEYAADGAYHVSVEITDNDGLTARVDRTIVVAAAAQVPVADLVIREME